MYYEIDFFSISFTKTYTHYNIVKGKEKRYSGSINPILKRKKSYPLLTRKNDVIDITHMKIPSRRQLGKWEDVRKVIVNKGLA